jgi:hypothetical protein
LSHKFLGRLALAVSACAAFAAPAFADPPAASVTGNSQAIQSPASQVDISHVPGTVSSSAPGPATIHSSVTTSLGGTGDFAGHPGASLHSDMSWTGSSGAIASTYNTAVVTYYFQVVGPDGVVALQYDAAASFSSSQLFRGEDYGVGFNVEIGRPIPFSIVDVIAFSGAAQGQGDDPWAPDPLLGASYIGASANPNGPHSPYYTYVDCPFDGCSQALRLGGTALFQTNTVYEVEISLNSHLTIDGPSDDGSATIDAMVDPIFRIDPNDPDGGLYTLTFSPGVTADQGFPTGGGVPEPAAWSVMLLGFAGLGARLRRRPRARVAA